MSYDRYVAICKPLHYTTIMNSRVCIQLVISSWLAGFLIIFPPVIMGLQLDFCDSNIIDHFTCDSSPMLLIFCTDTAFLEFMGFFLAIFTLMVTLTLVILSYVFILKTILRLPSAEQRKKAFSTCSSHMIVVSISYGSCIFIYVKTSAKEGVALTKGVAVLNTSVAPVLNPFIYSLRNQQSRGGPVRWGPACQQCPQHEHTQPDCDSAWVGPNTTPRSEWALGAGRGQAAGAGTSEPAKAKGAFPGHPRVRGLLGVQPRFGRLQPR
ncbi:hypothetical protein H8959_014874 [Pygathrix nigripes]